MLPICVCRERNRRKDDVDVAIGVNNGGASFSDWSKCIWNSEMGITKIRGP